MTATIIEAFRAQPITRPGQVEKVLIKFGISPFRGGGGTGFLDTLTEDQRAKAMTTWADPEWFKQHSIATGFIPTAEQMKAISNGENLSRDTTEWPKDYVSTVVLGPQADDGGEIELEIWLEDGDPKALVSELRACGFVAAIKGSDAS